MAIMQKFERRNKSFQIKDKQEKNHASSIGYKTLSDTFSVM